MSLSLFDPFKNTAMWDPWGDMGTSMQGTSSFSPAIDIRETV